MRTKDWELLMGSSMIDMLDKYGHILALRQAVPGGLCSCIDPVTGHIVSECKDCNGTGNLFADQLGKGRLYLPRPEIGNEQDSPLGFTASPGPVAIIEPEISPKRNDYLLELVLDSNGDLIRPPKIQRVYDVQNVYTLRDIDGKIAFYQIKLEEVAWGIK